MKTIITIINIRNYKIVDQWLFKGHLINLECFRNMHKTSDKRIVSIGNLKLWENLNETIENEIHSYIGYNYLGDTKIDEAERVHLPHLQKKYNLGKGIVKSYKGCHARGFTCYTNNDSHCEKCSKHGHGVHWRCDEGPIPCPYDATACNQLKTMLDNAAKNKQSLPYVGCFQDVGVGGGMDNIKP